VPDTGLQLGRARDIIPRVPNACMQALTKNVFRRQHGMPPASKIEFNRTESKNRPAGLFTVRSRQLLVQISISRNSYFLLVGGTDSLHIRSFLLPDELAADTKVS
jgi:hypothetical protein